MCSSLNSLWNGYARTINPMGVGMSGLAFGNVWVCLVLDLEMCEYVISKKSNMSILEFHYFVFYIIYLIFCIYYILFFII